MFFIDVPEQTYLVNNHVTGLLRAKGSNYMCIQDMFFTLCIHNYRRGGTRAFENNTTGLQKSNNRLIMFQDMQVSSRLLWKNQMEHL